MNRRTPQQVFRAGWPLEQHNAAKRSLAPFVLEELMLMDREARVVRDGGCVQINHAIYAPADEQSHAALLAWDGRKRKVKVACDPFAGRAVAYHPETNERIGALVAQRRFAWGEPHDNIKAHLRARGNNRRATEALLEQLPRLTTPGNPFAFLDATGADGAALIASSPRVLRKREQQRLAEPRIKTFACDVSDEAAALLDQVEVPE